MNSYLILFSRKVFKSRWGFILIDFNIFAVPLVITCTTGFFSATILMVTFGLADNSIESYLFPEDNP